MPAIPDDRPIIELRNLGPACEEDLTSAGIHTAGDIRKLSVKEAFLLAMSARQAAGKSTHGYNAAFLYALYGAIHDVDWREVPEAKRDDFKAFTASLRDGSI